MLIKLLEMSPAIQARAGTGLREHLIVRIEALDPDRICASSRAGKRSLPRLFDPAGEITGG